MSVMSFAGVVENGRIQLEPGVSLPEKTRDYVLVPGLEAPPAAHLRSPRLAQPEHATDFTLEVAEATPDAGV